MVQCALLIAPYIAASGMTLMRRKKSLPFARQAFQVCLNRSDLYRDRGSVQVLRMQALRALLDLKLYALPFFEGTVPFHVDSREMYEYILVAIVRGNKTIAFGIVEPFDYTGGHKRSSKICLYIGGAISYCGASPLGT